MLVLVSLFFFLFNYQAFANAPAWYLEYDKLYSSEDFFVATSASKRSFEDAIKKAQSMLAKQLYAKIRVKENYSKKSTGYGEKERVIEDYSLFSIIFSDIGIPNLQIVRKEKKDGKFYVLVVLKKSDFIQYLKNQIDLSKKALAKKLNLMKNYVANNDITSAMTTLIEVNEICWSNKVFLEILSRLTSINDINLGITEDEVKKIYYDLISSIKLTKISGDSQHVLVGKRTKDFILKVSTKNGSFLTNIPVAFIYDNKVIGIVKSNNKGLVKFSFVPTNENSTLLKAKVYFNIPYSFAKEKVIEENFIIYPSSKKIKINLILDKNYAFITDALKDYLKRYGFIIKTENNDYTLKINIKKLREEKITSFKTFFIGEYQVNIKLLKGLDGHKTISLNLKGMGESKEEVMKNLLLSSKIVDAIFNLIEDQQYIEKKNVAIVVNDNNSFKEVLKNYRLAFEKNILYSGIYNLVERDNLNYLINELVMVQSGLTNNQILDNFEGYLGADYIFILDVIKLDKSFLYTFVCKVVDVSNGKIIKVLKRDGNLYNIDEIVSDFILTLSN